MSGHTDGSPAFEEHDLPSPPADPAAERMYLVLALFDSRDRTWLADVVRSVREGYERSHPDMGEAENNEAWNEFDLHWNRFESHERLELARMAFLIKMFDMLGGVEYVRDFAMGLGRAHHIGEQRIGQRLRSILQYFDRGGT